MFEAISKSQFRIQHERRTDLFVGVPFILSLSILVLNDWLLKAAWHNTLTGKLSDFAGVALFALFWCALFPRHLHRVMAVTVFGFVWWKSPLSQPLIEQWNAWIPLRLGRTVDYSDLFALLVLPGVAAYVRSVPARRAGRWLRAPFALCALAAMMGTAKLPDTPEYRALMQVRHERVSKYVWRGEQLEEQDERRLVALLRTLPDKTAHAPSSMEQRVHRDDIVIHVTHELPNYSIQVWFYPNPRRNSEFNFQPRTVPCDEALAQGKPSTDPLLSGGIEFSTLPAEPWVTRVVLDLCDLPRKRSSREALRYFFDTALPPIEAALVAH